MSATVVDLWGDLRPTYVGPNTLAWSFPDEHPQCKTTYTVYLRVTDSAPRVLITLWDGEQIDVPATEPHLYGTWDSPADFARWARRYSQQRPLDLEEQAA